MRRAQHGTLLLLLRCCLLSCLHRATKRAQVGEHAHDTSQRMRGRDSPKLVPLSRFRVAATGVMNLFELTLWMGARSRWEVPSPGLAFATAACYNSSPSCDYLIAPGASVPTPASLSGVENSFRATPGRTGISLPLSWYLQPRPYPRCRAEHPAAA